MRREIELDFIRGIAILMVLDFHQSHTLFLYPFYLLGFAHFGWVGVDMFFILSGFLIGGLLMKEWKLRSRVDSGRFLVRRGFKIWPQYYVYLAVVLLSGHRTLWELRWNLLNVQNYMGGIAHTWSLAVEEHAYLLLIGMLALAAMWRVRVRHLAVFLACAVAGVMILRQVLAGHGEPIFSETHSRIDGILEGVLLAMLYHFRPVDFRRLQRPISMWLALLVGTLLFFRFAPVTPQFAAMSYNVANLLGIATLMLLYRPRQGVRRPWLYRVVAWIGLYSYGIYLWHVAVIAPLNSFDRHVPGAFRVLWDATVPLMAGVGLGWAMTRIVEFPALRFRDRLFPQRVDSAVGKPTELEMADAGQAVSSQS